MVERLKNQYKEFIRHELPQEVIDQAREETLAGGTFYIVPLSKYDRYDNGGPTQIAITPEQRDYLEGFISNPGTDSQSIGADLEHILPYVTDAGELGLDSENRRQLEQGLVNLVSIPQSVLRSDKFRTMFTSLLNETDIQRLEVNDYNPQLDYLHSAVLLRADLLLKEDGRPLSCDPNLMPLGYSIVHELASAVESQTNIAVRPSPEYLDATKEGSLRHPGKISGIITGLNYPNWLSHMTQAGLMRKEGVPFYVIPTSVIDEHGSIDIDGLNKFNRAFGIEDVNTIDPVPGFVIRYSRENKGFHHDTEVVNAPGIRLLETQVWPGIMALPGFYELAEEQGVSRMQVDSALSVAMPTLVLRSDGEAIEVATALVKNTYGYELNWENLQERQDLLLAALLANSAYNPSEKANELSWYLKTLSTSGNKGTAFTNDGRIDQTVKNIRGRVQKFGFGHGGLFLLQPKVRSILPAENEEERIKIDLFLSLANGKTVSIDYMSTPKNQRAAHGGSSTRIGLVRL